MSSPQVNDEEALYVRWNTAFGARFSVRGGKEHMAVVIFFVFGKDREDILASWFIVLEKARHMNISVYNPG
jgi:hypothetical protein